jgi:hypothetical protein
MPTFRKQDIDFAKRLTDEMTTTSGRPVSEVVAEQARDGNKLHADYVVLSDDEVAEGLVRPVRAKYVHDKCGGVTRMSDKIAKTYARNPYFYGSTFCVQCGAHYPVGPDGEFTWDDGSGQKVGT